MKGYFTNMQQADRRKCVIMTSGRIEPPSNTAKELIQGQICQIVSRTVSFKLTHPQITIMKSNQDSMRGAIKTRSGWINHRPQRLGIDI